MPFHERVKPLWEKSNMTLAQLADRCDISESSASRYISGKVSPSADIAEKILQTLGDTAPETKADGGRDMHTTILHIREIYEAQIRIMQAEHANRVAELRRDKIYLFTTTISMFLVTIYLCIDALHGNWGLFQYTLGG